MSERDVKELLKLLKKHDFTEVRVKGDHHRYEDGKGHKVTVPYTSKKDTIPKKTYRSILKQMGLK
ncbi:type II toxin-antitoxin system HicA family toxin [Aerococcus sanguinicola]|uniref:Toxin HicA n=1 Tax=Aerococcus sanguinicola TaxID=119206 RepID=A0A0X8FB42_9LACT|nr:MULTISPECIES: type II toxin-antitoxin system HicA family toxin [Aerococcus]AMB93292.1 toxin HicA [Aerococcus sanguinicola]MDK7049671.1 type II toxin-antitoxin system HicA family toxin [Aerococcus sanguinicola]OFT95924.1 toxin HicA [Aerococcus sp. HMSC23C02]PKZ23102.1 type II toxin-antitoxin system HicA family toxin [Aerococcus sanguinicola]